MRRASLVPSAQGRVYVLVDVTAGIVFVPGGESHERVETPLLQPAHVYPHVSAVSRVNAA